MKLSSATKLDHRVERIFLNGEFDFRKKQCYITFYEK